MEDASIPKGTVPEGRTEEPWAVSHSSSFFDLISSLQITNYYCSVSACPGTKESLHCARLYMKSICCTWFKQGTIWAACQQECGKWLLGRTSSVAVGCVKQHIFSEYQEQILWWGGGVGGEMNTETHMRVRPWSWVSAHSAQLSPDSGSELV